MDELSMKKVPFFFLVDFEVQNVEVYEQKEIADLGLQIDFKSDPYSEASQDPPQKVEFNAVPESAENYERGFNIIQDNLRAGNTYLANYTCKSEIQTDLSLEQIYNLAYAKYKVYYPEKLVFFSPETFVEIVGDRILTQPMKGTIDAAIANAVELLRSDPKEKAEHYTVVDLLRNDLSIVADNVKVDHFQRIDLIKTNRKNLYAMSSEISGRIKPNFQGKVGSILAALLPAGSILGAPKKKTLEIILEAENYSRGFYTGVCGWFDGENLDSCVMIRFIEKENGKLYFKSGGGITHLSKFADEYQEMKNKIYVPIY